MPYEINVVENGTQIITRYFGFLSSDDIIESYKKRFSDVEMIVKYKLLLSDYTDVTKTNLSDLNVKFLGGMYLNASSYNSDVIAIAILPQDLLYGLGRMWEVYVEDMHWEEYIFRSREEALNFMNKKIAINFSNIDKQYSYLNFFNNIFMCLKGEIL